MSRLFCLKKEGIMSPWFVTSYNVLCDLDLWGIDPGQGLNEDNICTKLDGNPSMHT